MKSVINYPLKVFATGFIVLVFLSLPLFWMRFACQTSLTVRMPDMARSVSISPTGLVPSELENDPNVIRHSSVSAHTTGDPSTRDPSPYLSLGIFDYLIARSPGERRSNIYDIQRDNDWAYFDKTTGLIVRRYTDADGKLGRISIKKVQRFAGPEGVSESPDTTLGRFIAPIIVPERLSPLTLYDKKLCRFFAINFYRKTVIKGPKLGKDDFHKPVQIGRLSKNTFELCDLNWIPPQIEIPDEKKNVLANVDSKPIIRSYHVPNAGPYLLVLDETGRIDLLGKETLEFVGTAGRLPAPETYFRSKDSVTPRDLLDYRVWPLTLTTYFYENPEKTKVAFGDPSDLSKRSPSKVDKKYLGMFAASRSRDGTALALAVFDEEGKEIKKEYSKITKDEGRHPTPLRSSKAVFFEAPWAPASTLGRYLAENLHPPILSLASHFTASSFEAAAGHRALFLLPNSFIAMKGRDVSDNIAERFMTGLWWISPSIILAILLAWRVCKDAAAVGLSENAKLSWLIGTIAFGLTAYITYRLTRPKITLVTCSNCGKLRRPDMDRCHRCGGKWHIPELTPPTWRVLDG